LREARVSSATRWWIVRIMRYSDLQMAAQKGDLADVEKLLSKGLKLNAFDELGHTPLHYAAMEGHSEVAERLLKAGANVNALDESVIGNTPLGDAAGSCSLAMAQLLIKYRADPTIRCGLSPTALERAQARKRGDGPAVYRLLVEQARKLGRHVQGAE
jgi:ankyrin repeat protein